MQIRRSALLAHAADDIYQLVLDVPRYPEFLSWCAGSQVLAQDPMEQLARLEITLGGLSQAFTTRNRLTPGERIELELEDGPFENLHGEWRFLPLGEGGCEVSLELRFEFSSRLLSVAFRRSFARLAERLVLDFARRAEAVYGDRP